MNLNEAEEYHFASRMHKGTGRLLPIEQQAEMKSLVLGVPAKLAGKQGIKLDIDKQSVDMELDEAILTRRSLRDFVDAVLPLDIVARILYLANGVRGAEAGSSLSAWRRNVPNAGNLGSIDIYMVSQNIQGVEAGLYFFDNFRHELIALNYGQFDAWLEHCVFMSDVFAGAAAVLFLVGVQERLVSKYGIRAYRLGLLDAGHVSQNINLTASSLGLAVCSFAGFVDEEVNEALGLDGLASFALLAIALGTPALDKIEI